MSPVQPLFSEDTLSLVSAAKRRQKDLVEVQVPRLQSCRGPLAVQQNLAAELRDDMDAFARQVEALDLSVDDQKGEKNRAELRQLVAELKEDLTRLRKDSRAALLASKRAIDAQSRSRRDELLTSKVINEKQGDEKQTGDALMKANDDVTGALQRTIALMQAELERSVLSTQMLEQSTASLRATSTTHDTLTSVLGMSKHLTTALQKSDWIDRVLIISSFVFFLLVVLFIIKQRILDRSIRIAFWWTRFLPDFSTDEALLTTEKGNAALISTVAALSSATVIASSPVPGLPSHAATIADHESSNLDSLYSSLTTPTPLSSETTPIVVASDAKDSDEPHRVADEL